MNNKFNTPKWLALSISSFFAGVIFFSLGPFFLDVIFSTNSGTKISSIFSNRNIREIMGGGLFHLVWAHLFGWPGIWAADRLMPSSRWRYIVIGTIYSCLVGIFFAWLVVGNQLNRLYIEMLTPCFISGVVTTMIFTFLRGRNVPN